MTELNPFLQVLAERRAMIASSLLTFTFQDSNKEVPLADQLRQHAYMKGQLDLLTELVNEFENPSSQEELSNPSES